MARSNVYQRPAGCGFRCEECGTEAAPLFGFENRGKQRHRDFTFCLPHVLLKARTWGVSIRPDQEARRAGYEFTVPGAASSGGEGS